MVCLWCKTIPKGSGGPGLSVGQQQPPASAHSFILQSELLCSVERGLAVKQTKLPAAFQPRAQSCSLALECPKPPREQMRVESASSILSLALQGGDVSANRDFGQPAGSTPGHWGTFAFPMGVLWVCKHRFHPSSSLLPPHPYKPCA